MLHMLDKRVGHYPLLIDQSGNVASDEPGNGCGFLNPECATSTAVPAVYEVQGFYEPQLHVRRMIPLACGVYVECT